LVKKIAAKAELPYKRVHYYLFRHGSATANASFLTDEQMKKRFGWSPQSRSPAVYSYLNEKAIDDAYCSIYGVKKVERRPEFLASECVRCKDRVGPGTSYCPRCGTPINPGALRKMASEDEQTKRDLEEFRSLKQELFNQINDLKQWKLALERGTKIGTATIR